MEGREGGKGRDDKERKEGGREEIREGEEGKEERLALMKFGILE